MPKRNILLYERATNTLIKSAASVLLENQRYRLKKADPAPQRGVYAIFDPKGKLIYAGETGNLKKRLSRDLWQTVNHAFRKNYGERVFKTKAPFSDEQEKELTQRMKLLTCAVLPVFLGRAEIEEYIIEKNHLQDNKKEARQA